MYPISTGGVRPIAAGGGRQQWRDKRSQILRSKREVARYLLTDINNSAAALLLFAQSSQSHFAFSVDA